MGFAGILYKGIIMKLNTKVITDSYSILTEDDYIGVNSEKRIIITLPEIPIEGRVIVIKAEMSPPMAGRNIVIVSNTDALIDGYASHIIQVSNDSVQLIYHSGNWRVI